MDRSQGPNLYEYVENSPTNSVDPQGDKRTTIRILTYAQIEEKLRDVDWPVGMSTEKEIDYLKRVGAVYANTNAAVFKALGLQGDNYAVLHRQALRDPKTKEPLRWFNKQPIETVLIVNKSTGKIERMGYYLRGAANGKWVYYGYEFYDTPEEAFKQVPATCAIGMQMFQVLMLVNQAAQLALAAQHQPIPRLQRPDLPPLKPPADMPNQADGGQKVPNPIDPKTLPLPPGMKNPDLGRFVNWSRGEVGTHTHAEAMKHAQKIIKELTPETFTEFRKFGLTKEMAQQWADFYRNEAILRPANPNAEARAVLMQAIADGLR